MKRTIILMVFTLSFGLAMGQNIQWAASVVSQNNAFGTAEFGASSILGAPNATPYGEINPNAFRLKAENGNGSVILSFTQPQSVKQIIIMENYMPGRIERVYVYDQNKNRYSVLEDTYTNEDPFGVLSIPVNVNSNTINQVEIRINAGKNAGWAQIDAVGITESADPSIGRRILQQLEQDERLEILAQDVSRRNLGLHVNSVFDEVKPVVSVDGQRLYFSRQYAPMNLGGSKDMLDIYYSDLVNGSWTEAKNIGSPLNDINPNGVASVTADGRHLLLINRYKRDGTYDLGLSITEMKNGRWEFPRAVDIEGFKNVNDYVDYSLSPNGDVLIMAIENEESKGDQDLYVSFYKGNDSWTKPQNLGSKINTPREDFSPFIAPDGVTLYFASAGHGGLGGSDIFYTRRLDDTWLNWSEPINMGPKVNTAGFDGYFSISANTDIAYVVSQTGGRANSRDIYQVRIPPELRPQESYMLVGTVYNAETNSPLADADVNISGGNANRPNVLNTDSEGIFKIMLPKEGDFIATLAADGFETKTETLDIAEADKEKLEVRNDFYLKPIHTLVADAQVEDTQSEINTAEALEVLTASLSDKPLFTALPEYIEKEMPQTFLEEEKIYNLFFKVVDANTLEEIPQSRLVFGLDAMDEVPLSVNNNRLSQYSRQMTMDESTIYLKAEATGYETERKVIPPDEWKNRMDMEFIILLNPLPDDVQGVNQISEADASTRIVENYNLNGTASKARVPIMEVSGVVFDAKTRQPLPASVQVAASASKSKDRYRANQQGLFKLDNASYEIYELEIAYEGYYAKKEVLDVERIINQRGIARAVYYLEPITQGEKVTLKNLWFVQSQPDLVEFSFPTLDSLGQVLLDNPSLEIKLSGHTDGIGDNKKNQNLSELRVAVIKEYLVLMGVHPKRILLEAFGSKFPIASNAREETRKLNRRVEVTILKY